MVYGTVIKRPETEQNLCLDNGYRGEKARSIIEDADYVPHVQGRSAERADKAKNPDYKPRRWVVEAAFSWFNRFRKLLVALKNRHVHIGHCYTWPPLLLLLEKLDLFTNKF
jgi:transposase